ncbi:MULTISPECIES: sulfatase-like hydrolase/transferase [unclassified Martelella]|uniref:sulfatase-like hydrolase/transferase n=1 Tax=unclassified Martelella TaxID=2629616 RepID=UPI0025B93FBC|nr:sulfatase-like hydrolase/transferase [Martelella sp.]
MRPNVLLITVDQWAASLLGVAGHPVIETPTLDALARTGTRFTNLYSECPVCIPARRTLMTGLSPKSHGDRVFQPMLPMPDAPTLAQCFRDGGYQAFSVGKLHIHPQRDRIGFDDALLAEEGRAQLGAVDDYDMFLADRGFAGQQYLHGMSNNDYIWRPWHLPEDCHVTNWTAREMCRVIKRRDHGRPAFWNMSFTHPHPPLVPLESYLARYAPADMPDPTIAEWARDPEAMPYALRFVLNYLPERSPRERKALMAAFFALCTHIDHQIRIVIGTLREEGILDDTAILFLSDHGDMLGNGGLYGKRLFLEPSTKVPGIFVAPKSTGDTYRGKVCDGIFGLADVMPTLLEIAGLPVPDGVDGVSMLDLKGRPHLYGECLEGPRANRMIRRGDWKLIWYPAGNAVQLFDLASDPGERRDLSSAPEAAQMRAELEALLVEHLYGCDLDWVKDGRLTGFEAPPLSAPDERKLAGQRGLHYPQPPLELSGQVVGAG